MLSRPDYDVIYVQGPVHGWIWRNKKNPKYFIVCWRGGYWATLDTVLHRLVAWEGHVWRQLQGFCLWRDFERLDQGGVLIKPDLSVESVAK